MNMSINLLKEPAKTAKKILINAVKKLAINQNLA
jgi:hypothetical protein